jgi:beta-lactamase regulating signal transducer with metallopeptidase domain
MNALTIQTLGSALLHFLWQGAALALLLWIAVSFTRDPRVRYGLAVCALALMALCPLATVVFLARPAVVAAVPGYAPVSIALSSFSEALRTPAEAPSFDWLSCAVWVWCGGVIVFSARALGGWMVFERLRRTAQETVGASLLESCRRLERRIGIVTLVRYAHSEMVDTPAVVGWFRPVVLIPLSALAALPVEQLEAIVAHELAHIKRYDALVNLFQIAAETVFFYHPAVWWVNRVIRAERENCCDDIAVEVCGNASEYARALATLSGRAARPAWAMAANGGALKSRVSRLLGLRQIAPGLPRAGLAVLAVLCASCVLLAGGVFKQETPNAPPPPTPSPAAPADLLPPAPPEPPDALTDNPDDKLTELNRELAALQNEMKKPALSEAQIERQLATLRRQISIAAALRESAEQTSAPAPETQEHSGGSYIDGLEAAGLTKLTVDDLIALKVQGVTADYVRQVKAAGFDPSIRDLIGMRIQGVTPEYIRDIHATGLKPTVRDLIGMKVQGVTAEYVRALQSAGLGDLEIRDFISAKVQGVTPEFIEKVRSHGFKNLTFRQLIGLKVAEVF